MPANPKLRGTDAHGSERQPVPFLSFFMSFLFISQVKTPTDELFNSYVYFVDKIAGDYVGPRFLAKRKFAFCKEFNRRYQEIEGAERFDNNPRGYNLAFDSKIPRGFTIPPPTDQHLQFRDIPADKPKEFIYIRGYIKIIHNGTAGWSGFAACDIPKGTLVATYLGEHIKFEEVEARENHYEDQGKPASMLDIPTPGEKHDKYIIDAHRHPTEDREFEDFENPARYINWQEDINLNMKFDKEKREANLYAKYNIPENFELFWDYAWRGRDRPAFSRKRKYPVSLD